MNIQTNQHTDTKITVTSRLSWFVPFLTVFFPVVLLSFYAIQTTTNSVLNQIETENSSAIDSLSQQILSQFSEVTTVASGLSTSSGAIAAVDRGDRNYIYDRLQYITNRYPFIQSAMVINPSGNLWAGYPRNSQARDADFSRKEWYYGVSKGWQPYISGVYERSNSAKDPVVAIAYPILSQDGVIGILVFEHSISPLIDALQAIQIADGGYLIVIDHLGIPVAHPNRRNGVLSDSYARKQQIIDALQGSPQTAEYMDPINGQDMMATFESIVVGSNNWVIIAQQPINLAYRELNKVKVNMSIAGSFLSLLTLAMSFLLARTNSKNSRLASELKETNRKLQVTALVVESSNDAVLGLDTGGKVKSWNAGAEETYEYSQHQMIDQEFDKLVSQDHINEMDKLLRRVRKGEEIKQYEMKHRKRSGKLMYVSLTLSPIKNADGDVSGISAIVRDISERKQIEQMKSDFTSFVSHQLKAPVTALSWMIEGILDGDDGPVTEEQKKTLHKMMEVNKSNYKLIQDILNASRIERGVIAISSGTVLLKDIVEHAMRDYALVCERKGLWLKVEEEETGIHVLADPDKAAEAISNSISNAIKYTEYGGITIYISSSDEYGIVKVADTGKGMSLETLAKLFTRDEIVGSSASPEHSSGLGLYIAKHFMQLQNGDLTAESESGKGSVFIYKLPLHEV